MPKKIANKHDWVELGYTLFSENGASSIIIEKMASRLQVNKSSFYWHFKTRDKFIDQIIDYWVQHETNQIIEQTQKEITPNTKAENFLKLVFKKDKNIDFIFHLKRYAKANKKVQVLIDKIDEDRIVYSARIFQELGYSKIEALKKAHIFYKYLIGYHEMIRNKNQNRDYLKEIKLELQHFLNLPVI